VANRWRAMRTGPRRARDSRRFGGAWDSAVPTAGHRGRPTVGVSGGSRPPILPLPGHRALGDGMVPHESGTGQPRRPAGSPTTRAADTAISSRLIPFIPEDHIVKPMGWVVDMRHYLDEETGDLPDCRRRCSTSRSSSERSSRGSPTTCRRVIGTLTSPAGGVQVADAAWATSWPNWIGPQDTSSDSSNISVYRRRSLRRVPPCAAVPGNSRPSWSARRHADVRPREAIGEGTRHRCDP
jgi:hypothetical protein